jgi:hypothetical protein
VSDENDELPVDGLAAVERAIATKFHRENSNLKARLEELELNYSVLQESNNNRWAENKALLKDKGDLQSLVASLKHQIEVLESTRDHWISTYKFESTKNEHVEQVYLKVIRALGGRD